MERKILISQRLAMARQSKRTGLGSGSGLASGFRSGEYVIGLMQGGSEMDLIPPTSSRPITLPLSQHNNHNHNHNHHHHSHDHYLLRHHDIHNVSNHHHHTTTPTTTPLLDTQISPPIKLKPTHPHSRHPTGNFYSMGKLAVDEFRDRMLDKDAILGESVVTQKGKVVSNDGGGKGGGNVGGGGTGVGGGGGKGGGDYLEEQMFVGTNQGANRSGGPPCPSIHIHNPPRPSINIHNPHLLHSSFVVYSSFIDKPFFHPSSYFINSSYSTRPE